MDATGRQFIFNGDNKQTEVKDASNNPVGRYYYGGNGKRVKKVTNTETVIFVYDGMGKLAAEYSTAAPVSNPTTNYTATDPLGSPRVITNKQGQIVSRRDFMPFGEEVISDATYRTANLKYGTGDNIRQKFTGYQRDEETGLDFAEARYYNNNHGRFTAVDPLLASGKSANPQTFNRYAYTMNRPLILTDPTGMVSCCTEEQLRQVIRETYDGDWTTPENGTLKITEASLEEITQKVLPEFMKQAELSFQAQWNINDQANNNGISAQTTFSESNTTSPVTLDLGAEGSGTVEGKPGAKGKSNQVPGVAVEGKGKLDVKGITLVDGKTTTKIEGVGNPQSQQAAAMNNVGAGGSRIAKTLDGTSIKPSSVTPFIGPPNTSPNYNIRIVNTQPTNEGGLRKVHKLASEEAKLRNPLNKPE